MSTTDFGDLIDSSKKIQSEQDVGFYSGPSFTSFADMGAGLETHNPFADLESSTNLDTSSLSPPPASQVPPATLPDFASLHQLPGSDRSDLNNLSPEFANPNLTPRFDISPAPISLPDNMDPNVGFDGQGPELSTHHFMSFPTSDNGFSQQQASPPLQTPQAFMSTDDPYSDQQPFEDFSQALSSLPRPTSEDSTTRSFEELEPKRTTSLSSYHSSPHVESQIHRTVPQSPAFRPFGVTATLTSSTDDDFDESILDNPAASISARPALPDILGGGTQGASVLLPDSRSALPAFKKTPKKSRAPSDSHGVTPPNQNDRTSDQTHGTTNVEVIKPYRPLGYKVAEAKPIIVTPPAEPPKAPEPNSKPLLRGQGRLALVQADHPSTESSSNQSQDLKGADEKLVSANLSSEPSKTTSTSTTDCTTNIGVEPQGDSSPTPTTSSATGEGIPTNRLIVSPVSTASTEEKSLTIAFVPTDNPNEIKTPGDQGLSISIPPPPASLPTVAKSESVIEPSNPGENGVRSEAKQSQEDRFDAANSASTIVAPIRSNPTSDVRQRTESESEDERPLASVRQGLVQQQSSGHQILPGHRESSSGAAPAPFGAWVSSEELEGPSQPAAPMYKCSVGDPQKMGMINDIHTVYTVKTVAADPSTSGPLKNLSTVLRRFRDFVWLFEVLTSNNPGVIVPPIPDKNLRNRFQEGFIAARRVALEIFLQKTVHHPMLISDPDLKLFLESDSFSLEVKHRKPDSSNQHGWLANIAGPRFSEIDDFFDHRKLGLDSLDSQLKTLQSSLSAASKSRQALSQSLSELSQVLLALSTCDLSRPMRNALDRLAGLHRQFHSWSEEQSRDELEGLMATVEAYSRLINSVRLTFSGRVKSWEKWQFSLNTLRKVQANHDKAKRAAANEHSTSLMYSLTELEEAERRSHEARNEFGDVSKLIKAEMQRFDKEKVEDFKAAICAYVDGLTQRQRQVVRVWQEYYQLLQALAKQNAEPLPTESTLAEPSKSEEPTTSDVNSSSVQETPKEPEHAPVVAEDTSAWASEPTAALEQPLPDSPPPFESDQ